MLIPLMLVNNVVGYNIDFEAGKSIGLSASGLG